MIQVEIAMDEIPLPREVRALFARARLAIIIAFLTAVYCASMCGGPRPAPAGGDASAALH